MSGAVVIEPLPASARGAPPKPSRVTYGDTDESIMMHKVRGNVDTSRLNIVGVRFDYTPFTRGSVDLFPVYRNTQGVELAAALKKSNEVACFFSPQETAGVHIVANSIVTSSRTAVERKARVQGFVTATLDGWMQALAPENKGATVAALLTRMKGQDRTIVREQVEQTRRYILGGGHFWPGHLS